MKWLMPTSAFALPVWGVGRQLDRALAAAGRGAPAPKQQRKGADARHRCPGTVGRCLHRFYTSRGPGLRAGRRCPPGEAACWAAALPQGAAISITEGQMLGLLAAHWCLGMPETRAGCWGCEPRNGA